MMKLKYKLSEAAADLNVPVKDLSDILTNRLGVSKKPATLLTG